MLDKATLIKSASGICTKAVQADDVCTLEHQHNPADIQARKTRHLKVVVAYQLQHNRPLVIMRTYFACALEKEVRGPHLVTDLALSQQAARFKYIFPAGWVLLKNEGTFTTGFTADPELAWKNTVTRPLAVDKKQSLVRLCFACQMLLFREL